MDLRLFLTVWALTLSGARTIPNITEWKAILPDLTRICPGVHFCETVNLNATYTLDTLEDNPCCQGCSCDSNCMETNNCCFDQNQINQPKRDCLFPITDIPDDRYLYNLHKYRFIVEEPYGGCKSISSDPQQRNATCSEEEKAAPWGNFFPVYSKKFNANFKNAPCALCHGADDIEEWNTSFVFYGRQLDFIRSVTLFNEKRLLWKSYLLFEPPNNEGKNIGHNCYDVIRTCPVQTMRIFYIPTSVQISREEMIDACENGPSALYIRRANLAYKNVFCAICESSEVEIDDSIKCRFNFEGQKSPDSPFLSLLDANYITPAKRYGIKARQEETPSTCYKSKHKMNESACHSPHCPLLQTRLRSTECGYVTHQAQVDCLTLCLNLTMDGTFIAETNQLLNLTGPQIVAIFEEFSPWSNVWHLDFLGHLADNNKTEFAICLMLNSKHANIQVLVKFVTARLSKRWNVRVNNKIHMSFNQEILKHGNIVFTLTSIYGTPQWSQYKAESTKNLVHPSWKVLHFTQRQSRFCLPFNEMFMCEQIELQPDEFQLGKRYGVLYLTDEKRILYPNEFSVLNFNDDFKRVRVCIKDSGYVNAIHTNSAATRKAIHVPTAIFLSLRSIF